MSTTMNTAAASEPNFDFDELRGIAVGVVGIAAIRTQPGAQGDRSSWAAIEDYAALIGDCSPAAVARHVDRMLSEQPRLGLDQHR